MANPNTGVSGHENEFVLSRHGFKSGGPSAQKEMNAFIPPKSKASSMGNVQGERGGFDKGAEKQKSGKMS